MTGGGEVRPGGVAIPPRETTAGPTAVAVAHGGGSGGHGHGEDREAINRFGLRLFIASESCLFAALVAARLYLAGFSKPEATNVGLGLLLTVILVASSALSYRGLGAVQRGDGAGAARWLTGTLLLGIAFVGGVAVEWSTAEFPIASPYGTAFFSTTGLHASHLLSGIVALALLVRLLRRGHFGPGSGTWGVTATVTYWTFVDLMWVLVIFPSLYLL